mmetsp:Transcript_34695/g.87683  ORF Transcript_34695/g.87683 Transcript_34695/m.87683 type:complete len:237 (+) Transcript_34695:1094-1804(+)
MKLESLLDQWGRNCSNKRQISILSGVAAEQLANADPCAYRFPTTRHSRPSFPTSWVTRLLPTRRVRLCLRRQSTITVSPRSLATTLRMRLSRPTRMPLLSSTPPGAVTASSLLPFGTSSVSSSRRLTQWSLPRWMPLPTTPPSRSTSRASPRSSSSRRGLTRRSLWTMMVTGLSRVSASFSRPMLASPLSSPRRTRRRSPPPRSSKLLSTNSVPNFDHVLHAARIAVEGLKDFTVG